MGSVVVRAEIGHAEVDANEGGATDKGEYVVSVGEYREDGYDSFGGIGSAQ